MGDHETCSTYYRGGISTVFHSNKGASSCCLRLIGCRVARSPQGTRIFIFALSPTDDNWRVSHGMHQVRRCLGCCFRCPCDALDMNSCDLHSSKPSLFYDIEQTGLISRNYANLRLPVFLHGEHTSSTYTYQKGAGFRSTINCDRTFSAMHAPLRAPTMKVAIENPLFKKVFTSARDFGSDRVWFARSTEKSCSWLNTRPRQWAIAGMDACIDDEEWSSRCSCLAVAKISVTKRFRRHGALLPQERLMANCS